MKKEKRYYCKMCDSKASVVLEGMFSEIRCTRCGSKNVELREV